MDERTNRTGRSEAIGAIAGRIVRRMEKGAARVVGHERPAVPAPDPLRRGGGL